MLACQVHEAMSCEGVAAARDIEAEVEPLAGGHVRHVLLHLSCALGRDPVLLGQPLGAVAGLLHGCARVELEAAPRDPNLVGVLEIGQRGFEAALSDVAPRAGDVRPDLHVHGHS